MTPVERIEEVLPGIRRWSAFSPAHRVELSSTAVCTASGWWIFDPIPVVNPEGLWNEPGSVAGIILTNENHERDAAAWASRCHAHLWAAPEARLALPAVSRWLPAVPTLQEWYLIPLPGGPPGETAFFLPDRSLLILGDAVVNLPGRELEVLPDKYCQDPRQLRESLRHLPPAEQALFAHGTPLIGQASARLTALVPL